MSIFSSISASIFLSAFISIASIALMILLGVWVYRDAQSKDLNGVLWTIVVLLVPSCIGLIIYLIVRADAKKDTPVIEENPEDESFKASQKKILIGFFGTLGGIAVASILMLAFTLVGIVKTVDTSVKAVTNLGREFNETYSSIDPQDVENALKSLESLLAENGINVNVNEDGVVIKADDDELIRVDENGGQEDIHIDSEGIYSLLEKYNAPDGNNLQNLRVELIPAGETVPSKVITEEKEIGALLEKIDMENWKASKLPDDAKELGTVCFTSSYNDTEGNTKDISFMKIQVYKDVPYIVLDTWGIKISMQTDDETSKNLNELFD